MKAKYLSLLLCVLVGFQLVACGSVYPTETAKQEQAAQAEEELARVQFIDEYKIRYLARFIMELPPIPTEEELAYQAEQKRLATPYKEVSDQLISYCQRISDSSVTEFVNDFADERYAENEETRILKKMYDGKTGVEINGGLEPETHGLDTGYWRITNCKNYNMLFYTNEEHNSVRVIYRCNAYHYTVKNNEEDLAAGDTSDEMTIDNTVVESFEDVFFMTTITDICPSEIESFNLDYGCINPKLYMYTSYDDAIASIQDETNRVSDTVLDDTYSGSIIDGYIGKPIVAMPDLIGKYIDVAKPNNVRELDARGITNYKINWVENNGEYVSYSVVSTNVEAGDIVDITDEREESMIVVDVADKAPESIENDTEEGEEGEEGENTSNEESTSESENEAVDAQLSTVS